MKTVLAALNAKFIHTNPAIRSVKAYAEGRGVDNIHLWERTINHRHRRLLTELAGLEADVVVFSLYIWNVEEMKRLAADLKKAAPATVLVAAGPEASCRSGLFLDENPCFDFAVAGEGEQAVTELLRALAGGAPCQRVTTAPPLPMDELPFPYEDLEELDGRILYYESMRGCPFSCSYCLSSLDKGVRYRGLPLVYADLGRFLAARVRQVKLVDRTFNCDGQRALAIWRFLMEKDNGVTNFHFELAGELMDIVSGDHEAAELLAAARPGQFQFEIGVQSCNQETLAAIRRPADLDRLFAAVKALQRPANIHLHLDLIAGLPFEGFDSFVRSFNAVYALGPEQLQLGFLKVLKGSALEAEAPAHGIVYSGIAPYEVLGTRWLSFPELARLQAVADMVELYYNSGRFSRLVADICREFATPFDFYDRLAAFFAAGGHNEAPPAKVGYYGLLGGFLAAEGLAVTERRQWLCKYDLALQEKPKKLPDWVQVDLTGQYRPRLLAFLAREENVRRALPEYAGREPKWILKAAHIEVFPFDPVSGAEGATALAFDYRRRDIRGRARVTRVDLP